MLLTCSGRSADVECSTLSLVDVRFEERAQSALLLLAARQRRRHVRQVQRRVQRVQLRHEAGGHGSSAASEEARDSE